MGGLAGLASGSLALVVKSGYVGQLYDAIGFSLSSSQTTVAEAAQLQIQGVTTFDDATTRIEPNSSVTWSVLSGPFSISSNGLASAAGVYQDEQGRVLGRFAGRSAVLNLSVIDVDLDNFGSYGSDGIEDSWQIGFFGLPPNVLAGPGEDPDGDLQDNLFEFLADLDPKDAASRFFLEVRPVAGQPLRREIIFSPVSSQRTYTVLGSRSLDLTSFQPISTGAISNLGGERTVTHLMSNTDVSRFYIVDISTD